MKGLEEGLSFTDLLYGVVIGSAFGHFTGLEPSVQNGLLLVSLFLILDDYLLYHHEVRGTARTGRRVVVLFWLDVLVLLAWYATVLAAGRSVEAFLLAVAGFYMTTALWEAVFAEGRQGWRRLATADWMLVGLVLCPVVLDLGEGVLRPLAALLPLLVLGVHGQAWRRVWREEDVHA